MKKVDISGQIRNPRFVKDLKDPKTGRPCRKGVKADVHFFKHSRGREGAKPIPQELIDKIKAGNLNDNSIGFTYEKDPTPGEFEGQKYDYVQRDIFLDHLAAPIEAGRCPSPYCGLGADAGPRFVAGDPWEETEQYIRSGHRSPSDFDPDSLRTIDLSASEGIKAIVGCPQGKFEGGKCSVGMEIQSYLFDIKKWDMAKAKAWFNAHKSDSVMEFDCPICDAYKGLGGVEFSKRLVRAFGKDAVLTALTPANATITFGPWVTTGDSQTMTISMASTLDQTREEAKAAQEARSKKYGIGIKEGGNVTKPGEFASIPDDEFADPVNYAYPIDADHVMAAWAYISKPENQSAGGYTTEEWSKMQAKVKAAMEKHGHTVADERKLIDVNAEVMAKYQKLKES